MGIIGRRLVSDFSLEVSMNFREVFRWRAGTAQRQVKIRPV
jgi:hypothetical protein